MSSHKYKVGEGASMCYGLDRYAGTVIEVSDDENTVKVQRDFANLKEGYSFFSESQEYEYNPNKHGEIFTFSLDRDTEWFKAGRGDRLIPGRDEHFKLF